MNENTAQTPKGLTVIGETHQLARNTTVISGTSILTQPEDPKLMLRSGDEKTIFEIAYTQDADVIIEALRAQTEAYWRTKIVQDRIEARSHLISLLTIQNDKGEVVLDIPFPSEQQDFTSEELFEIIAKQTETYWQEKFFPEHMRLAVIAVEEDKNTFIVNASGHSYDQGQYQTALNIFDGVIATIREMKK